jgi:M6 family metalloprotease-like protein
MRKHLRVAALIIPLVLVASNSYAAVKAGSSCSKAGIKSVSAGKTYTCVKSGKKLVWNKGVLIPVAKPAPTPSASQSAAPVATPEVVKVDYTKTFSTDQGYHTDFSGPCQVDQDLNGRAAEIQTYFFNLNRCAGQMRVNKYTLGSARPSTPFESKSQFSNTEPCKLVTPKGSRSGLGFTTTEPGRNSWANARRHPSPNTVIQLVPIYSNDSAQPKGSPSDDYQFFLEYMKNWIEYSSDFGSNVEIRIPDQYIKMDKNIADYKILHTNNHDNAGHQVFNKDVVAAVDSKIDFKGAHIAIVVPPAGTEASVLGQGAIAGLQTQEGLVPIGITEYAAFAANPSKSTFTNLSHPFWWIHELFHAGYGLDDHYGDTKQNLNTEYGMGWLTMMTPFGGDLTTWEKWLLGFMKDSQIQCVSGTGTSTHWIAPSTVKTDESKAVIIRVSDTKVIIVETLRPAGLYYKLPKQSQGALIYELDLTKDSHGMGMKLLLPLGRNVNSNPFFMASYPLKSGDSTISNGYKITIIESGTFGDVVKVERV